MSRIYDPRFDVPVSGDGFYAEYFTLSGEVDSLESIDFDATPDMVANVDSLDHNLVYGAFWEGGTEDWFAARYTSELNVATSGSYTFYLNSDDGSALYIDGEKVIDSDGLHATEQSQVTLDLTAGTHAIEVRYFEAYGAQTLQLHWERAGASGDPVLVNASNLTYKNELADSDGVTPTTTTPTAVDQPDSPAGDDASYGTAGLMAEFFMRSWRGKDSSSVFDGTPAKTEIIDSVNFGGTNQTLWQDGASKSFAVRITGNLHIDTGGAYTFYLTADDASTLYVNGVEVIVNKTYGTTSTVPVTLSLDAGAHDIEIRYVERRGDQNLVLEWRGPDSDGVRTLVGGTSLSHGDIIDQNDTDGETTGGSTGSGDDTGTGGDTGTGSDTGSGGDTGTGGDTSTGGSTGTGGDTSTGGDTGTGSDTDTGSDTGTGGDTSTGGSTGTGGDTSTGGDTGTGSDTGGDTSTGGDTGTGDDTGTDGTDHGHDEPSVDLPSTPAEIAAFVAAVMAEPDAHAHGDDPAKAAEHAQLLDLVPRSEATHVAVSNGDWFDPGTWYQGNIPGEGAKVLIPDGVSVTYNGESDVSLFTVRVDGELSFATDVNTSMLVDTFVVSGSGRLEMGTAENPIAANVTAEIIIANNGDIDVSWDPTLLSRGIISHGETEIHGAEKDPFLKVSDAPMRGDTSLSLAEIPDGWRVGDTIIISGTHREGWTGTAEGYVESQDEEVTITAINGNQITFDTPLIYDHDTPREDLFAYVANMTRNITFSSEDGDATEIHHRGHVMFMHNDDVDVRYAAFDDLGRTDKSEPAFDVGSLSSVQSDSNIKSRYPFHFHKTGTADQDDPAMAVGNTVSGSPGWGFVHHSSNANFTDNVAFDVFGAAFAAESGDETGVWVHNMAIRAEGIGFGEWEVKEGGAVSRQDTGRTGDGFFFAGRLVEAAENVAINTTNGFVWMTRNAGADPLSANLDHPEIAYGDETTLVNISPIQGFRDNEAFGTYTGLMVIKANAAQQQHELRTVMDGFLNWETHEGVNISYTAHYTLIDFDLLASDNTAAQTSTGVEIGAMAFDLVFNGLTLEGFDVGVDLVQDFFRSVADADVDHIFIDMQSIDLGRDFAGFNPNRHHILTSDDLTPGQLGFVHNGDTTLSEGEAFDMGGIKTDSIGTRQREYDGDPLSLEFYDEIAQILTTDGYYKTTDGRNVIILEDFIVDRATGEMIKFSHIVTLNMTDAQLQNNWMLNNYFDGVVYNGVLSLNGSAPTAVDDTASTRSGEGVLIDAIANDFDRDGDILRVDGLIDAEHGDVYMQDDGRILYQPNVGFTGTDTFTYWAADDEGHFVDATVTIDVW